MRILHVIHSVDPRSGGPSHALRELARAQIDAGNEVAIVATTVQSAEPWSPRAEFIDRIKGDLAFRQVDIVLLPAYGRRRPWSRWAYTPGASRELNERLGELNLRPDVVHIHGTFSHLTSVAARVAKRHRIPYVLRPAGSLNGKCLEQGAHRLKSMFIRTLLTRELRNAACVQAMSESEARELATFVPSDCLQTIPHGIDIQPLTAGAAFDQFPELSGRRFILFLSRLHPKKRPGMLVEALARLRSATPDLMLVLAGTDAGALLNVRELAAQHGIADRVLYSPFIEGVEKSAAFQAAAVFALPSIDENFGVAVIEAMANGAPVLVTPGVATHTYVDASGCGLTVDGNVEAVADGLQRILAADRDDFGRRGRKYVADNLTWEAIVSRIEQMYQACIDSSLIRAEAVSAR